MDSQTTIDLSRLPFPDAIEKLSFEELFGAFQERFEDSWNELRVTFPDLPEYNVGGLETDPVVVLGEAWSFLRLLDRARVNDAVKSVLAPMAKGADLDNIAVRQGVHRLTLVAATEQDPAVMEGDAALLRRYLLSFDRPSAGSVARYLYEAWTAAPGLHDIRVNGRAVHGRVGDTDIVILGAGGAVATSQELATVQAAITQAHVKPEAVGVAALPAQRTTYSIQQTIIVPSGPDAELVRQEALARVNAVAKSRMLIGAGVPRDLIAGAAFGPSVIDVVHIAPAQDIPADPYRAPVCTGVVINVEVQS